MSELATTTRIDGVMIGVLMGFAADGAPLVVYPGNPSEAALPARTTAALTQEDVGREVALLFEAGDPARPLVVGRLIRPEPPPVTVVRDGAEEILELTAERELLLRCGKASITLTRAGKVLIRGEYISSRSTGANRVKGGSVHLELMAATLSPCGKTIIDIVEQHAEEAAFLGKSGDAAVEQPHYAIRYLRRLEERIESHLDGLRVAGEIGFEIALRELVQHFQPGELFAVAILTLELDDFSRLDQILEIATAHAQTQRGLFGAIGGTCSQILAPRVAPGETRLTLSCAFLGWWRVRFTEPIRGLACRLTDDPDSEVRTRALRLVGELGRSDLLQQALRAMDGEANLEAARWAGWSVGLLADSACALPVLMPWAVQVADGYPALDLAIRLMPQPEATDWIRPMNSTPAQARCVARAVGALGDPAALPWLIAKLADPAIARLAGESFSLITGIDVAYSDLDTDPPHGFDLGPTDDPLDERVAAGADDHYLGRPRLGACLVGAIGAVVRPRSPLPSRPSDRRRCM